jgi:hypothetical protein
MSKGYSTCAGLKEQIFEKLIDRYTFLKKTMEKRISEEYQDKWRSFIKRSLRNVEFLDKTIPEEVIQELSYRLELKTISKDDYLFKTGAP